jgi:hypothetical protein
MRVPRIATTITLVIAAGTLLLGSSPARAEFDNDKWVAKQLKCDGFDDNRCYRYVDPRRRGKPFLKPPRPHPEALSRYYRPPPTRGHRPPVHSRVHGLYYGRDGYHRRPAAYAAPPYHGPKYYDDAGHGKYFRGHYSGVHDVPWDGKWPGRYDRFERVCLNVVTVKGTEAQTENGALISAKRAWRASVRSDFGERYQDLDHAKDAEYRCWRSSTNESVLGRAGEWLTGQYRKRCQVWAIPCLGDRQKLEGDKDDRE